MRGHRLIGVTAIVDHFILVTTDFILITTVKQVCNTVTTPGATGLGLRLAHSGGGGIHHASRGSLIAELLAIIARILAGGVFRVLVNLLNHESSRVVRVRRIQPGRRDVIETYNSKPGSFGGQ